MEKALNLMVFEIELLLTLLGVDDAKAVELGAGPKANGGDGNEISGREHFNIKVSK